MTKCLTLSGSKYFNQHDIKMCLINTPSNECYMRVSTLSNNLDLDQAFQNAGPALDPNCEIGKYVSNK